jgi:hypothetical protein
MIEENQFSDSLDGDVADPVFVRKCIERFAAEIKAAKAACEILTGAVMGILAAIDALNDESRI